MTWITNHPVLAGHVLVGDEGDNIAQVWRVANFWSAWVGKGSNVIGMFETAKGYVGWKDFSGMVLAGSIIGMIGCIGGAGGRYGEQRFLATRNTREAAMMAALWQFLGFPRWLMTAGLCFLAYALYSTQISTDPECVMPLFLKSGLLKPGLLGLVVAATARLRRAL